MPLNTGYTAAELDYFVSDAEPVLYVGEEYRSDIVSATLQPRDAERLLVFSDGAGTSDDFAIPLTAARATDDLAAILYTSGTTGRSKQCSAMEIQHQTPMLERGMGLASVRCVA